MTRENKLALVVGFGLILFVGILVSDHFSTARHQESADLMPASHDIVAANRYSDEGRSTDRRSTPSTSEQQLQLTPPSTHLTAVGPHDRQHETPGTSTSRIDAETSRASRKVEALESEFSTDVLKIPDIQVIQRQTQVEQTRWRFHEIASGESMGSICRTFYGDESLWQKLAAFNEIDNPNLIHPGRRIRIPDVTELDPTATQRDVVMTSSSTTEPKPALHTRREYTIESGDVLSSLAQEFLGSSRQWRELFEYNRDVIGDPDRLTPGTVIRIPDRS